MSIIEYLKSKTRLRNVAMWTAGASLVLDILIYSNVITLVESEQINMLIQRGLELLIIGGILSNPSNPNSKGFNL